MVDLIAMAQAMAQKWWEETATEGVKQKSELYDAPDVGGIPLL